MGNVYVSNGLSTTNVIATTMNTGTMNVTSIAVSGSTATTGYLLSSTSSGTGLAWISPPSSLSGLGTNGILYATSATSAATVATYVYSGGNVGIGTAGPTSNLHVYGSSTSNIQMIINNVANAGGSNYSAFVHSDQAYCGGVGGVGQYTYSGASLLVTSYPNNTANNSGYTAYFGTSASDTTSLAPQLVIKAATGYVGIGTASPGASKMFVYSTVSASTTNSILSIGDTVGYGNGTGDMTVLSGLYSSLGSTNNIVQQIGKTNDTNSYFYGYNGAGYFWISRYGYNPGNGLVVNNGNVGIGTTSPGSLLNMYSSQNSALELRVQNPNTGTGALSQISFLTNDASGSGGRGGLAVFNSTYTASGQYRSSGTYLYNNGAGGVTINSEAAYPIYFGTSNAERMRIDSAGYVGIGTASPLEPFHIYTGNNGNPTNTGTGADSNAAVRIQMVTIGLDIGVYGNGTTWIQNRQPGTSLGTTFNMVMQPLGGNVGIGTVSPANLLHVSGGRTRLVAGSETYALGVSYSEASGGLYYIGATNSATPDMVFSQGGGSERMRITNGGNVGIGLTNPTKPLVVVRPGAGGANPAIMVGNNGAGSGLRIQTYDLTAQGDAYMGLGTDMSGSPFEHSIVFPDPTTPGYGGNSRMTFGKYNGTTYTSLMTLLNGGNLGIGTASPQQALDVVGNIRMNSYMLPYVQYGSASGNYYFVIDFGGATGYHTYVITLRFNQTNVGGGSMYFYARDTATTQMSTYEYSETYFRAGQYSTGNSSVIATNNEQTTDGTSRLQIEQSIGAGGRCNYMFDTVYCWANVGQTRCISQGWFSGGNGQIRYITIYNTGGTAYLQTANWTIERFYTS